MLGLDRCRGKGDNKQNKQRTPGWRTQMLVSLTRREMSSSVGLTEKSASHGEPKNLMFYNQVPDLNYIYSIYIYTSFWVFPIFRQSDLCTTSVEIQQWWHNGMQQSSRNPQPNLPGITSHRFPVDMNISINPLTLQRIKLLKVPFFAGHSLFEYTLSITIPLCNHDNTTDSCHKSGFKSPLGWRGSTHVASVGCYLSILEVTKLYGNPVLNQYFHPPKISHAQHGPNMFVLFV